MNLTRGSSPAALSTSRPTGRPQALSRRAITRLRIAAALMHMRGDIFEIGEERAAREVLDIVDRLTPAARDRLRALVDWVEAYARAEQVTAAAPELGKRR